MCTGVDREMSLSQCGGQTKVWRLTLLTSPYGCNLPRKEPCENYAESKKHAYYDKDFKGTAYEFAAMVFETTGGVNAEGLELLRQLFRFAAKHQNLQLSVYCGRACHLVCKSVSQCFLNRAAIEKDIDFVDLNFRWGGRGGGWGGLFFCSV